MIRIGLLSQLLLCLPVIFPTVSKGALIATFTATSSPGQQTFDYDVTNDTGVSLIAFGLTTNATILSVSSPAGWVGDVSPSLEGSGAQWIAIDADLVPSASLPGFSITLATPVAVGMISLTTLGDDFSSLDGQASGPVLPATASSPEPGSVFLVLLALALARLVLCSKLLIRNGRKL